MTRGKKRFTDDVSKSILNRSCAVRSAGVERTGRVIAALSATSGTERF